VGSLIGALIFAAACQSRRDGAHDSATAIENRTAAAPLLPCATGDSLRSDGTLWFGDAIFGISDATEGGTMLGVVPADSAWAGTIEPVLPTHRAVDPATDPWPAGRQPAPFHLAWRGPRAARLIFVPRDSATMAMEASQHAALPVPPESVTVMLDCREAILLLWPPAGAPDTLRLERWKTRSNH
jgi:hypothetical protein